MIISLDKQKSVFTGFHNKNSPSGSPFDSQLPLTENENYQSCGIFTYTSNQVYSHILPIIKRLISMEKLKNAQDDLHCSQRTGQK